MFLLGYKITGCGHRKGDRNHKGQTRRLPSGLSLLEAALRQFYRAMSTRTGPYRRGREGAEVKTGGLCLGAGVVDRDRADPTRVVHIVKATRDDPSADVIRNDVAIRARRGKATRYHVVISRNPPQIYIGIVKLGVRSTRHAGASNALRPLGCRRVHRGIRREPDPPVIRDRVRGVCSTQE
jgi:hypothetical protein